MANFTRANLPPLENETYYDEPYVWISDPLLTYLVPIISIIGLPGNGIVIYLLGFRIKRTPFTTYILNLAVADFGVLLFLGLSLLTSIGHPAAMVTHSTSQLLLTAISIDRCVAVLFPIWHRCHRPRHLSTMVCALMWVISCLLPGSLTMISFLGRFADNFFAYLFIACGVLCLPLVTISTMILLFKVFCKSQHPRGGRLLTIVLITLLFFLIFAFPLNAIFTYYFLIDFRFGNLQVYGLLCACLNSCVNPVIYYMVGRKKRGRQRQSLKVILQRAFKEEEEEQKEEQGPTAQTSL